MTTVLRHRHRVDLCDRDSNRRYFIRVVDHPWKPFLSLLWSLFIRAKTLSKKENKFKRNSGSPQTFNESHLFASLFQSVSSTYSLSLSLCFSLCLSLFPCVLCSMLLNVHSLSLCLFLYLSLYPYSISPSRCIFVESFRLSILSPFDYHNSFCLLLSSCLLNLYTTFVCSFCICSTVLILVFYCFTLSGHFKIVLSFVSDFLYLLLLSSVRALDSSLQLLLQWKQNLKFLF